MRTDSYRNTYAREGAPAQMPPPAAPVQQPQVFNYTAPPRTAPDTEFRQASPDTQVPDRIAGEQGNGNNRNDVDGVPLRNAPSPQAPGAETQPAGAVQDANGNFVFDRWDEAGTHVVDKFNKQTLMRSHEETDTDGASSLLVFNERTGQRSSDVYTSDGSHRHSEWNQRTGKHKDESWSPQGQYQFREWDEDTARMQTLLRQHRNDVEQALPNNRRNLDAPTSAAPGDVSQRPVSDYRNTGTGAPDADRNEASPRPTNTDWRPVGDGRYGRGTGGQGGRGHVGPGGGGGGGGRGQVGPGGGGGGGGRGQVGPGGGGGGGGGSAGPTGGAGNATVPNPEMINTGASQFSQEQLNRLNAAPQKLMQFLDVALARLDKYGANDPELQQWFGKNASVDEIRQTLTRMRETLASGNYKFSLDPNTRDNWEMAHVFPNDKSHTIHVRPHMLDPVFGKNTPEVTLFHELSHFDDIGKTRDLVYGDYNAATLAQRDSNAAMHNAENYGMFIRQVAQLA